MLFDKLYGTYPVIESKDILLKKIESKDLDDLYAILSCDEVFDYIPGKAKKNINTVENMMHHYERDFLKKKMIFLGIYINAPIHKLVGIAEIFDVDKKVNMATIGYRLHLDYWGQGIATKATGMMLEFLFNDIEVNRIQGFVMPENVKSSEVLKRNNFVYEGTLRESQFWKDKGIIDLQVYSILKKEYSISLTSHSTTV